MVLISSITGILLAYKKHVNIIQPPTARGTSTDAKTWKSVYDLSDLAQKALTNHSKDEANNIIDRLDFRPSKGIVKVIFEEGNWEVQLDATTGETKSVAKRHSDWIEALHDGSIISELFKLISMNFLGIGLLILLSSGLWLWYGPGKVRLLKKKKKTPVLDSVKSKNSEIESHSEH